MIVNVCRKEGNVCLYCAGCNAVDVRLVSRPAASSARSQNLFFPRALISGGLSLTGRVAFRHDSHSIFMLSHPRFFSVRSQDLLARVGVAVRFSDDFPPRAEQAGASRAKAAPRFSSHSSASIALQVFFAHILRMVCSCRFASRNLRTSGFERLPPTTLTLQTAGEKQECASS